MFFDIDIDNLTNTKSPFRKKKTKKPTLLDGYEFVFQLPATTSCNFGNSFVVYPRVSNKADGALVVDGVT
jgi:hypothetical protein